MKQGGLQSSSAGTVARHVDNRDPGACGTRARALRRPSSGGKREGPLTHLNDFLLLFLLRFLVAPSRSLFLRGHRGEGPGTALLGPDRRGMGGREEGHRRHRHCCLARKGSRSRPGEKRPLRQVRTGAAEHCGGLLSRSNRKLGYACAALRCCERGG